MCQRDGGAEALTALGIAEYVGRGLAAKCGCRLSKGSVVVEQLTDPIAGCGGSDRLALCVDIRRGRAVL